MNIPAIIKGASGDQIEIVESQVGFLTLVVTPNGQSASKMQFTENEMSQFSQLIQFANQFARYAVSVAKPVVPPVVPAKPADPVVPAPVDPLNP